MTTRLRLTNTVLSEEEKKCALFRQFSGRVTKDVAGFQIVMWVNQGPVV